MCIYIYVCIYTYIFHVCIYICMHIYQYIHIYIYMYIVKHSKNKALKRQKEQEKTQRDMVEMELTPLSWHKTVFPFRHWKDKGNGPFWRYLSWLCWWSLALYLSTRRAELRCDGLAMNMLSAMSIILFDFSML